MICLHEKIKSENCVIKCMLCGEVLPIDYIIAKPRIEAQKQAENPAPDPEPGNNPPEPETPAETPKKTVKTEQKKARATRQPKKEKGGTK